MYYKMNIHSTHDEARSLYSAWKAFLKICRLWAPKDKLLHGKNREIAQ